VIELAPVSELVPHQPPMLALDELLSWSPGHALARLTLRDGLFARNGRVDAVMTLEFMAQGVAACLGQEALLGGHGPRVGMIIACRSLRIERPSLEVGEQLFVEVRQVRGAGHLSHYDTWTRDASQTLVARASLTLMHGEQPPQANRSGQ
jgi:predicted hotdog family 3-hydroxylacyl-ACP dehydratase